MIPGSALQHIEKTQRMGSGGKALLQRGPIFATKRNTAKYQQGVCGRLLAAAEATRLHRSRTSLWSEHRYPKQGLGTEQFSWAIWHQKGNFSIFSGKLTFQFTRDVIQNLLFCPGYLQDTFILYPSISHHHIFQKHFAKTKKPRESEI